MIYGKTNSGLPVGASAFDSCRSHFRCGGNPRDRHRQNLVAVLMNRQRLQFCLVWIATAAICALMVSAVVYWF
jgi:hypothetical protein